MELYDRKTEEMSFSLKEKIQAFARQFGYEIHRTESFDPVMDAEFRDLVKRLKGLHLQSVARLYALYQAVQYLVKNRIEGDAVECGVYKGASLMLSAWVLQSMGDISRKLYFYDTFEGWPKAGARDRLCAGGKAVPDMIQEKDKGHWNAGKGISLDEVRRNMRSTGYPEDRLVFVKGKVEDTLPGTLPSKIALLRLDTDWYESTRHELIHLFPRLVRGGVLILDDYGHWKGAKDAVDDYFLEHPSAMILHRIDYTGRIGVKPS